MTDREWIDRAAVLVQDAETEAVTPQDRIRAAIRILRVADAAADRVMSSQPRHGREQARLIQEFLRRAQVQLMEFQ